VKSSLHTWKSYLEEVREEVHLGVGIFGEDEHLQRLLQECFEVGDALNGVVYWDRMPPGSTSVEHSFSAKSHIAFQHQRIAIALAAERHNDGS
jgi:hypothetical protein